MDVATDKKLNESTAAIATVLCATDFSPAANQAAQIAASFAKAFGARLELLHVIQMPALSSPESTTKLMGVLRDSAEMELARKIDSLAGRGVAVSGRAEFGVVDEVLPAEVARTTPRLLVLGNHNRKGMNRFLGSVAERTLGRAQCPVLVVPENATGLRKWEPGRQRLRVTAGVDLSLATEAVAEALRRLAQATPCDLDIVHLFWPPREHERLGLAWRAETTTPDAWVDTVLGRELRGRVGRILEAPRHEAAIRLRPMWGDEPDPLLKEAHAHRADLLVVGVNRRGPGSTALATLRAADLPVLCVPAADPVEHDLHHELRPVRSVLVPFDFSPLASEALPEAYRLVRRGGTVVLVHVADPGPQGLAPEVRADLERDLAAYVPPYAAAAGIATHTLVYEGRDAAEALLQVARRLGVDLVVMSSHGRTGLQRALAGSVAQAVMRHAVTPVVLVPSRVRSEA